MDLDIDGFLRQEMQWAIQAKKQVAVSDSDGMKMRVHIVGQHGEIARTPLFWRSMEEKRIAMTRLSFVCKIVKARAAVVTTDSRFLNVPAFCIEFGLSEPTPETYEAWDAQRDKVMARFNYEMVNLPRHCYDEALLSAATGPGIAKLCITPYQVVGDHYQFEETNLPSENDLIKVCTIPQWWE